MPALRKCRDCKAKISKRAKSCPHCGAPKPTGLLSGCLTMIVGVIGLIIVLNLAGVFDEEPQRPLTQEEIEQQNREREMREAQAARDAEEREAAREAAAARQKADLDAMMKVLNELGVSDLIKSVSVSGDRVTVTVHNTWHVQPYQIRLQAAQNLWELWATVHRKSPDDSAYITIEDYNGNEVGGSKVFGGIWVQER